MLHMGYLIILDGQSIKKISFRNSIAFGSAPRREVDSQPISPRASKQAVTDTHSLGFLSVADAATSSREARCRNTSSGRVVRQPTGIRVAAGSNPSLPTFAPPPAAAARKVGRSGFEPTPAHLVSAALPLDRWPCYQRLASPLLVAY